MNTHCSPQALWLELMLHTISHGQTRPNTYLQLIYQLVNTIGPLYCSNNCYRRVEWNVKITTIHVILPLTFHWTQLFLKQVPPSCRLGKFVSHSTRKVSVSHILNPCDWQIKQSSPKNQRHAALEVRHCVATQLIVKGVSDIKN